MITVRDAWLTYGDRALLRGVNLTVNAGECIAVVGPNGCGKSTFLKVLAGRERLDRGEVSMPNRTSIGYLPQEADLDSDRSLRDELLDAFRAVRLAREQMSELEARMETLAADSEDAKGVMEAWARASHLVESHGGYALESEVARVASGLGFSTEDLDRSCREFSGGWKMRILLARTLLERPDVLLLDEPTNHLDLETLLWFEQWIRDCGLTAIMVSHERATMDRLVSRIVCLETGEALIYTGNYTAYLRLSAEERERRWEAYTRQQEEITSMERFIQRFRATASRARLVQSRIKQLEKVERLEQPFNPTATIHFQFPKAPPSYSDVIVMEGLGHSYDGASKVFSGLDLTIRRGEKVGLVGRNGAGKSTLLAILAGRLKPSEGSATIGRRVAPAYFAQYESESLRSEQSLLEAVEESAPRSEAGRARDVLGAFLFSGDDAQKPLRVLSGGERTRFRLARMLFSDVNLLLLDEPTNHLDVTSRATVEEALRKFEGSVVIVSHDRVFMDRVTNRIVELEDGRARHYPGNYSDYLSYKERVLGETMEEAPGSRPTGSAAPRKNAEAEASVVAPRQVEKSERVRHYEERKEIGRRMRAAERRTGEIEDEIERLEQRLEELDAEMARPEVAADFDRLSPIHDERRQASARLGDLLGEWESLHTELERLQERMG